MSNDVPEYVTAEMFSAGVSDLKAEILQLDRKLDLLNARVIGVNERIEDIKFYVSLVFGVLAVVVAFTALIPAITKGISSFRQWANSEARIQAMIDAAVSKALEGKQ